MYKFLVIILAPCIVILMSYSSVFLSTLFGEEFVLGSLAFKIILVGVLFGSIATINNSLLTSIGKPRLVTKVIISASIVNLVLNLILIPLYNINGAAVATVISYMTMFSVSIYELSRNVKFKIPWSPWIKTVVGSYLILAIIFLMKKFINVGLILEIIIILLISGVLYVCWLFWTRIINYSEIKGIVDRVLKK